MPRHFVVPPRLFRHGRGVLDSIRWCWSTLLLLLSFFCPPRFRVRGNTTMRTTEALLFYCGVSLRFDVSHRQRIVGVSYCSKLVSVRPSFNNYCFGIGNDRTERQIVDSVRSGVEGYRLLGFFL